MARRRIPPERRTSDYFLPMWYYCDNEQCELCYEDGPSEVSLDTLLDRPTSISKRSYAAKYTGEPFPQLEEREELTVEEALKLLFR